MKFKDPGKLQCLICSDLSEHRVIDLCSSAIGPLLSGPTSEGFESPRDVVATGRAELFEFAHCSTLVVTLSRVFPLGGEEPSINKEEGFPHLV